MYISFVCICFLCKIALMTFIASVLEMYLRALQIFPRFSFSNEVSCNVWKLKVMFQTNDLICLSDFLNLLVKLR